MQGFPNGVRCSGIPLSVGFSLWGRWGKVPPTSWKFAHFPPPSRKNPLSRLSPLDFYSHHQRFLTPTTFALSFEKCSNSQNHFLSDYHPPDKKKSPTAKFPILSQLGRVFSLPLNVIWETLSNVARSPIPPKKKGNKKSSEGGDWAERGKGLDKSWERRGRQYGEGSL